MFLREQLQSAKYCKEIKHKHKDYRAECHGQSNDKTSYKNQQQSRQGSSRQKLYQKIQNSRQMSRESIVTTKTVVLVRENSCSLINIPNYLGSELINSSDSSLWVTSSTSRPRLQLDLTKEATSTQAARGTKKPALCITCIVSVVVLTAMAAIILILTYLT